MPQDRGLPSGGPSRRRRSASSSIRRWRWARSSARSTACCSPAVKTSRRRATAKQPHPSVVDVDAARDEFEIALIGEARRRNLPIFAICRGIQMLNVACGGTLVQDIAVRSRRRARAQLDGAAAQALRPRARSVGRQGHAAGAADARALERHRRVRSEQPASPGGEADRARLPRVRHRARRRDRGDRGSSRPLLPRRPVAPRKLLAHRRVPPAVRRLPRSGHQRRSVRRRRPRVTSVRL